MAAVNYLGAVFIRVSDLEKALPFYSEVLGLQLKEAEQWDNGRGANYLISENSPLLTLIETEDMQVLNDPVFNLNCTDVLQLHQKFTELGVEVGEINNWSSEMRVHIDFDVYDPYGNAINFIEWHQRSEIKNEPQ
jgi:lactoylglutathione lyase